MTIKKFSRDFRCYYAKLFDLNGFSAGKDHWNKGRWLIKVKEFCKDVLGIGSPTDLQLAKVGLLVRSVQYKPDEVR